MTTTKFKVPLQTEVAAYIQEKKGWPLSFCLYYAEKFWSFYQSNGWKVSGRAAMKDWKCAFNSNWQNLKFLEDQQKLQACIDAEKKLPQQNGEKTDPYSRLDQLMMLYKQDPKAIEDERYCKMYDWLNERKMIVITKDQLQIIQDLIKNYDDEQRAKCRGKIMSIQFLFLNMIGRNERFTNIGKSHGNGIQ